MKKIHSNRFFSSIKNKNLLFLVGLLIFWWTFLSNVNIGNSDVFHDRDQDGLTDEEEFMYGTDINNPDSDGDGYRDGVEVESGYDPLIPAPEDKILFKNETSVVLEEEDNLTEDFLKKLETEKNEELALLGDYYNNTENFNENEEKISALNKASLTSEELRTFVNQTVDESDFSDEMELISEDKIIVLDEPQGTEEQIKKQEKEQVEKYLTQFFYVMAVNRPFAIEDQNLLPQLGAAYINQITGGLQLGQIDQLSELKQKAQKTYEECLKIETPEKTKEIHIKTLSIIKYLIENINEEKLIDQQDPVTMALYVGKLQAALIEGEAIKSQINALLKECEIDAFTEETLDGIF